MITKLFVSLSTLTAAALLFFNFNGPVRGELTLGSVLDKTIEAKSLELQVVTDDSTANVLVWLPGHVRWSESPTKYRIAAGSKLWRIDELANTVQQDSSAWFSKADSQIDLLAMLGIEGDHAARFRETVADGRDTLVFQMEVTSNKRKLIVEALADKKTGTLQTIAAWPAGDRNGRPLAELTVVARNQPVDESKFVVAKSLSADGRIGKVVDSQGIVTLRPMTSKRWTPIARQMLLKPGDWLRTDIRGANASALVMTSQFTIVAGPGSLVELQGPQRLRLHGGELKITGGENAEGSVELLGPDRSKVTVAAGQSAHYRIDRDGKIQEVGQEPLWLAGFEGSTNDDSVGSLVAKIDGRDVPLSVGFHKVKVEIRDQIARTTIEESFVNRTGTRLEGVFHFPLPQDASISGFGMWINGKLIEADVVEKQRAREIYETILRENRDPGLLEWAGGNIFKARVFPIEPRSEKRIRITYTQVLPLRANRFRYSYGLRSEMLQTTPMRELSLEVQVHSALPLKAVTCSTHAVRSQVAKHSAKLEFTAQEYSPDRDFEVVCEVDSRQSDVVVVPHRRGDDGYFLVQLTPPGRDGNWQRETLADGDPLNLLLVCDTSASMSVEKRQQQQMFVASLLAALGPQDKFNLAVSDVECHWRF
ncbi:MAG: VIT domain-containing protein, partial [Planctomycetaceae bacterium]